MKHAKHILSDVAGLTVGGVVASKVANMNIGFIPEKVKPILPIVVGFLIAKNKNPFLKAIGAGMVAVGGMKTIGAFAPGLGISALEDGIGADVELAGLDGQYALAGPKNDLAAYKNPFGAGYALAGVNEQYGNPDLVG